MKETFYRELEERERRQDGQSNKEEIRKVDEDAKGILERNEPIIPHVASVGWQDGRMVVWQEDNLLRPPSRECQAPRSRGSLDVCRSRLTRLKQLTQACGLGINTTVHQRPPTSNLVSYKQQWQYGGGGNFAQIIINHNHNKNQYRYRLLRVIRRFISINVKRERPSNS